MKYKKRGLKPVGVDAAKKRKNVANTSKAVVVDDDEEEDTALSRVRSVMVEEDARAPHVGRLYTKEELERGIPQQDEMPPHVDVAPSTTTITDQNEQQQQQQPQQQQRQQQRGSQDDKKKSKKWSFDFYRVLGLGIATTATLFGAHKVYTSYELGTVTIQDSDTVSTDCALYTMTEKNRGDDSHTFHTIYNELRLSMFDLHKFPSASLVLNGILLNTVRYFAMHEYGVVTRVRERNEPLVQWEDADLTPVPMSVGSEVGQFEVVYEVPTEIVLKHKGSGELVSLRVREECTYSGTDRIYGVSLTRYAKAAPSIINSYVSRISFMAGLQYAQQVTAQDTVLPPKVHVWVPPSQLQAD